MSTKLTVIYNDTCPICAREVGAYRRVTSDAGLDVAFAGLSHCDLTQFDLTPEAAAQRFHVIQDGVVYDGVPAFLVLWQQMPRLRWLAWLLRLPLLHWGAVRVYDHVLAPALYALHRRRKARGVARHIG
jgi:predicted DCC family thiol-disulfide oxidoreductase YuxK